jgi:hypothetical protein
MAYHATKQRVSNRGIPPDSFLDELVAWDYQAPARARRRDKLRSPGFMHREPPIRLSWTVPHDLRRER